ncbi:MAG TPA: hypothetical protein VIM55_04970 [Mucilaginibacter sp.]
MTFDEFFKKKRIDTAALQKAEPALFSEFKAHYEQMGEKSFDHTKKYWFNKTRRQFPLAPEVKTEKPQIANPIAEQTITESLTEHSAPAPAKMDFTPKFRAGVTAKPAEPAAEIPAVKSPAVQPAEETAAPKPAGFVPRFKAKTKTEQEKTETPVAEQSSPSQPEETAASKPAGFVPRFKAKPKVEEEKVEVSPVVETPSEGQSVQPEAAPATKPSGFVPRFKAQPKKAEEEKPEAPPAAEPPPAAENASKPAYKPRFVPPKKKEE